MIYSEGEICEMYRTARKKKEQIGILADLNITNKESIIEILEKHGYDTGTGKKKEAKEPETLTKAVRDKIAEKEFIEKRAKSGDASAEKPENPVLVVGYNPPEIVWTLVERRIKELNELTESCRKIIEQCTEEFGQLYEFQVAYGKAAGDKISQKSS